MHALPAKTPVALVSRSVALAPGRITAASLSCPYGRVPVSGGVSGDLSGVDTLRSRPHLYSWQFRLLNPEGAGTSTVRVSLTCMPATATTVGRSFQSSTRARGKLACPTGFSATGFGWDYPAPQDAFQGFLGWVIRQVEPGWKIVASDLAYDARSPSGPIHLYGRCVRHQHFERVRFAASPGKGEYTVERRCPRGGTAVGGGFSLGGDQFLDGFALSTLSSGRWTIFNRGPRVSRVRLTLVCMS